jgi:hypothetical protein
MRVEHDQAAGTPRLINIDEPTAEMLNDRLAVGCGGDNDGGMPVDETLAQKSSHSREQALVVAVKLNGMVMVVNWELLHDPSGKAEPAKGEHSL